MTFKQALEYMFEKNEKLKGQELAVDKSEYEKKAARGLYMPKVWLEGKHTQIDDNIIIDLNDIRLAMCTLHGIPSSSLPPFETTIQESAFSNANINFSWLVFTGGKILAANRAADADVNQNFEQLQYTRAILTTELVKRYYGFTLSKEASRVYKKVLDAVEEHLNQAKILEKNGMLAKSERLHAEVAYAEALRMYKKSLRKSKTAQAGLKNTLSSSVGITPVSKLFLTKKILPLEDYIKNAGQNNHLLKKLNAKKEMADQNYKAKAGSYLPKVFLFGKYELYKEDLTVLEPEWSMGVGVNFSVFEGLSNRNSIIAAKKEKAQIRFYVAKAIRDIETLVEEKYNELFTAIEQFDSLEASMNYAAENLRIQQKAFNAGATISLKVIDAQTAMTRVKIERLNAVYDFDVALAELLEVCGTSEKYEEYQKKNDVEVRF